MPLTHYIWLYQLHWIEIDLKQDAFKYIVITPKSIWSFVCCTATNTSLISDKKQLLHRHFANYEKVYGPLWLIYIYLCNQYCILKLWAWILLMVTVYLIHRCGTLNWIHQPPLHQTWSRASNLIKSEWLFFSAKWAVLQLHPMIMARTSSTRWWCLLCTRSTNLGGLLVLTVRGKTFCYTRTHYCYSEANNSLFLLLNATNTNFIDFDLTWPGFKPTIFRTQSQAC